MLAPKLGTQPDQYILVPIDLISRYVLLYVLLDKSLDAIVIFVDKQIFLVFGAPYIIRVDNGTE